MTVGLRPRLTTIALNRAFFDGHAPFYRGFTPTANDWRPCRGLTRLTAARQCGTFQPRKGRQFLAVGVSPRSRKRHPPKTSPAGAAVISRTWILLFKYFFCDNKNISYLCQVLPLCTRAIYALADRGLRQHSCDRNARSAGLLPYRRTSGGLQALAWRRGSIVSQRVYRSTRLRGYGSTSQPGYWSTRFFYNLIEIKRNSDWK